MQAWPLKALATEAWPASSRQCGFSQVALAETWCISNPTCELHAATPERTLPKTLAPSQIESAFNRAIARRQSHSRPHAAPSLRDRLARFRAVAHAEQVDSQAGIVRVQGKGEKTRIVPVDAETAARSALLRLAANLAAKGKNAAKTRALFLSTHGHAYTRQGFWKLLKKYALRAGLPADISPHVLRHAFATHLLGQGMNLRSLQMLLGHSDISTTEIYSHVSTTHLHEAVRRHPRSKS